MNDNNNSLSPMSCDEVLGKSLDLSTNMYSAYLDDMKADMNQLRMSLASTQKELENVILENNDLKRQITCMNQEISVLKQLCKSPITSLRLNTSTGKKNPRRRLTDSFRLTPLNLEKCDPDNSSEPQPKTSTDLIQRTEPIISDIEKTNTSPSREARINDNNNTGAGSIHQTRGTVSTDERNILILGSQGCAGLATRLIKLRANTQYEKYKISSWIKPNATTEDILKTKDHLLLGYNDKLVLYIGENDINPTKILIELCVFLKSNPKPQVCILSVLDNRYLNVNKLNSHIKNICSNFQNCKFVNVPLYNVNMTRSDALCRKINHVIDSLDYNNKYLKFMTMQRSRLTHPCFTKDFCNSNKAKTYKQMTLLDYFSVSQRVLSTTVTSNDAKNNPLKVTPKVDSKQNTDIAPLNHSFRE